MKKRLVIFLTLGLILSGCLPSLKIGGGQGAADDEFVKEKVIGGFPNLPLYPEAKAVESIIREGALGAVFISSDDLAKVTNFYNSSLGTLGWEFNVKQVSDKNFVFEIKNDQYTGAIIVNIAADGKKTAITYNLDPR